MNLYTYINAHVQHLIYQHIYDALFQNLIPHQIWLFHSTIGSAT
jgi:hypothetical protein